MDSRFLPTDEIIRMARSVLRDELGARLVDSIDFHLTQSDHDLDGDLWVLQLYHPAGTVIDHDAAIRAQGRLATAVFEAGDPRLLVLRHRFQPSAAQVA